MSKFFINRPIVAMVIAILMTIVGLIAMISLPVAQYPNIVPPSVQVNTTYTGADALTVEQSVATPIEQQMSGVDNMIYMYSLNANNGNMQLNVNFDVKTSPDTDQILTQMRETTAESQLPETVQKFGVTVQKSTASPLILFSLYSPKGTWDATFLSNYAFINLNDPLTRVPGIASITIFGAGQYAMRFWVNPDVLAKLNITVSEIINAVNAQNTVNPAGSIGAEPCPPGQQFTYAVRAQGRLVTEEQFGQIVVRANSDGSFVRLKDVARIELGAQTYNVQGRLNGKPSAIIAVYQLPGSNAIQAANGAKKYMEEAKKRFPPDLDYVIALDTTLAITAGVDEIVKTLWEALALVVLVVFVFLQGWRATLIPLLAVPVSLVGTFMIFPLLGFSINTLSLFGLVLAIGLVVDDAIVVVEAIEHHIEAGLSPHDAAIKAMQQVSGPVMAIALILCSVFIPTAFVPGITGRMYQQFAVTIAVSVVISAFNALTLSPALGAMLLRPKKKTRGPLGWFFDRFNWAFGHATDGYVNVCGKLIRLSFLSILFLVAVTVGAGWYGMHLPSGFIPEEDQGYMYVNVTLPNASSLQRTSEVCRQVEAILQKTPGVQYYTTVVGFSLLSGVQTTYNGFFFVTLTPWGDRLTPALQFKAIAGRIYYALEQLPGAIAFPFAPPAIPGIGASGGITFMLEDRAGKDVAFLATNTAKFMAAAQKRPEFSMVSTTALLTIPQKYAKVDQDKVLKQGVQLSQLYQTMQAFMGGVFINYFNRFGYQWQTYVEAEGAFRTKAENIGEFYVRGEKGEAVPLSSIVTMQDTEGPEFTERFNQFRCSQITANMKDGYSTNQGMKALEEVFKETMPTEMGYDYNGMSYQEEAAAKGVPPEVIFGLSLLFVFLILAAQYESWSLPFSVLLGTPIAVFGAFLTLDLRAMQNNVYSQIGLVMLIGLAAKNAILIIEFCRDEVEQGKGIVESALAGARLRLRPILMTAFAFILGCMPLWFAVGSGAVSRRVLGTTVVGGMLASTLLAIFLIPVCFYIVERLTHREKKGPAPVEPSSTPPPTTTATSEGAGEKN